MCAVNEDNNFIFDNVLSNCYTTNMETATIPNDPLSRFSISIFIINGLLMRSGELVTRPLGQSSARWQVLGRAGYMPQTVAAMARDMGHARQGVQRIADALAREGLVAYKDNPNDKRARLLEVTPKGMKVLGAIYERDQEWSKQLMTELDPDQLVKIADALESIGQVLETHISQRKDTL
jgi:DNA-binding MarR family transcriptional regulator